MATRQQLPLHDIAKRNNEDNVHGKGNRRNTMTMVKHETPVAAQQLNDHGRAGNLRDARSHNNSVFLKDNS